MRAVVVGAAATLAAAAPAAAWSQPLWPAPAVPPPAGARPAERWPDPPGAASGEVARPRPRGQPELWQLSLGLRTTLIRGSGFDPFSSNDALTQLSVAALRTFRSRGHVAISAGLTGDFGSSQGAARAATATLSLNRGALLLDARYQPRPRLQAFARVAPGVVRGQASVSDASAIGSLAQTFTLPSLDGSAGAAVAVSPEGGPVSFWLVGEGGYGWTPQQTLVLSPNLGPRDQSKAGALDLGALAPRGAFFRLGVALGF
jgi:hypothetical protein